MSEMVSKKGKKVFTIKSGGQHTASSDYRTVFMQSVKGGWYVLYYQVPGTRYKYELC